MTPQGQPTYPPGSSSIAIELLRTGTPYNQLLSPDLTYLALCGDYPAVQFRIELEQALLNKYLRLLRYNARPDDVPIEVAKQKLQAILTKLLADIPALQQNDVSHSDNWLHLRLVMTPRELAMLPFELTLTPPGFRGEPTTPLLLNPDRFTTITREVRQTTPRHYTWPVRFRILFVWAEPEKTVPHDEHLARLRAAIRPWVCPAKLVLPPVDDDGPLLTELPRATLATLKQTIETAIRAEKPFTHIHILAHGTPINDPDSGPRFALALHREQKASDFAHLTTEPVDGDGLTAALLMAEYTPTVVTIAACDSGNEGTTLLPGGSLAQVLHLAGVPYVLASQFPLSQAGSSQLIDDFYPRLLQGEDPRTALYCAREALARLQPQVHDWASLVAYARFPDTFDEQLKDVRIRIALDIMKAANAWSEALLKSPTVDPQLHANVRSRLDMAIARLETLLGQNPASNQNPARLAEHLGLLGSAYKRLSEHLFWQSNHDPANQSDWLQQSNQALIKARDHYRQGNDKLLINHWTGVQYLSLTAVLDGTLENEYDRWCIARFAAEKDYEQATGDDKIWSLGTLAELFLLKPLTLPAHEMEEDVPKSIEKAGAYLREMNNSGFDFAKESTARQLDRYITWWPVAFPSSTTSRLKGVVGDLRSRLTSLVG